MLSSTITAKGQITIPKDIRNILNIVNHIVICELVWVLKKCYRLSKLKTINVIQNILRISQFSVENAQIIWQALTDYKKGTADFADYVVGRTNIFNDCDKTITFDKKASKSNGFVLLSTETNKSRKS